MGKALTKRVTWVGKVDWELKAFHGEEYSTYKGSSYNSYLIRDEKTALIDTVWQPFDKEFVSRLKQEIDLNEIDYIVINHGEIDHSGALPELLRAIPGKPVYCTQNAVKSLKGHYHQDWNFVPVKTGDTLSLGSVSLAFVEAPMLHWPDTMFTYLTGENILFANDAFGQHYATESLYNDKVDTAELYGEAMKYYANILTPFSPLVLKKIQEVLSLNLPVDMICPSHGVIWKENPTQILEQYVKWADKYQENQVTILYDSMWNATRKMAEAIGQGIREADPSMTVKLMHTAKEDKNDVITQVFRSKAILLGSSTINNGYLSSIGGLLEMMRGLKFQNKQAAAFGSYGWSGEAVKMLSKGLTEAGFELISDGLKMQWVPDEKGLSQCVAFGQEWAERLKKS